MAGVPNRERERERERKKEREREVSPSALCETHSLIDRGWHMSRGIRVQAQYTSTGRTYECRQWQRDTLSRRQSSSGAAE